MSEDAIPYRCFEGMKIRNLIEYLDRYMDCDAMYELGYRYIKGYKVRPNKRKALYWFYNSAMFGHEVSMYILGTMYLTGEGCYVNYDEALYWLSQAADAGIAEAAELRDKLCGAPAEN